MLVDCAADSTCGGMMNKIKVHMTSVPPDSKLIYKWCISSGVIVSGQGTDTIEVDISGSKEEQVTVTIMIGGLDKDCSNVASYHIERTDRTD
jgi:hypothetical protein